MNQEYEKKKISLDMPEQLYKKLKIFCVQNDVFIKEFITEAIIEKLESVEK